MRDRPACLCVPQTYESEESDSEFAPGDGEGGGGESDDDEDYEASIDTSDQDGQEEVVEPPRTRQRTGPALANSGGMMAGLLSHSWGDGDADSESSDEEWAPGTAGGGGDSEGDDYAPSGGSVQGREAEGRLHPGVLP